ncbi:MAG: hypothetical protein ACKVX7_09130, partial [Planctomycetota bacterium]
MRALTLLSTAAILAGTRTATGQDIRWNNPLGGSWNLETNWTGGEVPDSFSETAIIDAPGEYTVEFDRSTMLRGLRVENPNASLNLGGGDSLFLSTHVATMSGIDLTINGALTVNAGGENRITEIIVCDFDSYDYRGLRAEGTGTIRLNAHPDNLETAQITGFCSLLGLTIGANQTIAGTGRVQARILNDGIITADVPGRVLHLSTPQYWNFSNEGELRAESDGILRLEGAIRSERNPAPGRVVVADAESTVDVSQAYLWDHEIDNSNGGQCVFGNECVLRAVRLVGAHGIQGGNQLWLDDDLTNDGTLTVRSDGSAAAVLNVGSSYINVEGTGVVFLNGTVELPTLARIAGVGGEIRFYAGQTLTGSGQITANFQNRGTASPGSADDPIGLIELSSTEWEQWRDARLVIDIGGREIDEYDRITRVHDLILDGTLTVRVANGFAPSAGDEFAVITHFSRTGTFDEVLTEPGSALRWQVRYDPYAVVLTARCATDFDRDDDTDLADLALLLANFG